MIGVALVIAVTEPCCDFSQVLSPISSQHNAQSDCGLGVRPFTTRKFMRLPYFCTPTKSVTLSETDVLVPLRSMLRSTWLPIPTCSI
jgi:hypothetical protein